MKLFILVIGMVLIIEGLPYAASPETMQSWLEKLTKINAVQLRIMGIAAMALGFFLCYVVQKTNVFN